MLKYWASNKYILVKWRSKNVSSYRNWVFSFWIDVRHCLMIFKDFIKTFDFPFIIHMFSMDTLFIKYILVWQKAHCTCVKVFFSKRSFQGCKYTFLFYFCLFNETNNEKTSPNICKVNLISCKTVSLRKRIFVKETKTKRGSKQRLQNT